MEAEEEKQLKMRQRIATELTETEQSYVHNLQTLIELFFKPLQEALKTKPILKPEEIKSIFSGIDSIVSFNAVLAAQLAERMKSWGPKSCVGDIFDRNSAFLKMYTTYVNGFSGALVTISKCKETNPEFVAFLERVDEHNTSNLDLQSYLIMPVQRLPRYVLLLTELLKHTPTSHPGYKTLTEALAKVKEIADFVNEAKRSAENAQEVLSIQDSLTGSKFRPIMEAHRHFDSKGTLTYFSARKNYKPKSLQYFLFNDLLILCWPPITILNGTTQLIKFRVKEIAHLFYCKVEDMPNSDSPPMHNIIKLKGTEDYTLGFGTPEEKEHWVNHYNELSSKAKPRKEISVDVLPKPDSPRPLGQQNLLAKLSNLSLHSSHGSPPPSPKSSSNPPSPAQQPSKLSLSSSATAAPPSPSSENSPNSIQEPKSDKKSKSKKDKKEEERKKKEQKKKEKKSKTKKKKGNEEDEPLLGKEGKKKKKSGCCGCFGGGGSDDD